MLYLLSALSLFGRLDAPLDTHGTLEAIKDLVINNFHNSRRKKATLC